jgi:hypothetical protein
MVNTYHDPCITLITRYMKAGNGTEGWGPLEEALYPRTRILRGRLLI